MTNTKPASISRPPIVVVMGHIDHGKSTLLDYLRQTKVAADEAGGITQAVGAYEASCRGSDGREHLLTFLDTPGHEAFGGIRGRGAAIADLAILVISAEEGVKAQTLEALADIRAAEIPFIVAINKIDRPNANPQLVKQQLAEQNVLLEGYGGTVPEAEISAQTGQGVPELIDLLVLLAALENLETQTAAPTRGFVLETNLDHRSGGAATLIIKDGTLHLGDFLVSGGKINKIRRLNNFAGQTVRDLPPSSPAQVVGLGSLPEVGAEFRAFDDKQAAENYLADQKISAPPPASASNSKTVPEKPPPAATIIPLVLKADVSGSLEAVIREVRKLDRDGSKLKIIGQDVGRINENDIKLGGAGVGVLVLGFNVAVEKSARDLAEKMKVTIATFDIIYKLSEWLTEKVKWQRPKSEMETVLGRAKLLKIFGRQAGGPVRPGGGRDRQIVGGIVTEGKLAAGKPIKIFRRDNEIGGGKIMELQQQKLPAKEVSASAQFGALVEVKFPLVAGDVLEAIEAGRD